MYPVSYSIGRFVHFLHRRVAQLDVHEVAQILDRVPMVIFDLTDDNRSKYGPRRASGPTPAHCPESSP